MGRASYTLIKRKQALFFFSTRSWNKHLNDEEVETAVKTYKDSGKIVFLESSHRTQDYYVSEEYYDSAIRTANYYCRSAYRTHLSPNVNEYLRATLPKEKHENWDRDIDIIKYMKALSDVGDSIPSYCDQKPREWRDNETEEARVYYNRKFQQLRMLKEPIVILLKSAKVSDQLFLRGSLKNSILIILMLLNIGKLFITCNLFSL